MGSMNKRMNGMLYSGTFMKGIQKWKKQSLPQKLSASWKMHKQPPLAGWAYNRDLSRGHGGGRLGFTELLGTVGTGALHAPPGGMEPGLERDMTSEEWALTWRLRWEHSREKDQRGTDSQAEKQMQRMPTSACPRAGHRQRNDGRLLP